MIESCAKRKPKSLTIWEVWPDLVDWRVTAIMRSLYSIAFRLSSVCLSSVTLVRRTQAVQIFGNISTALGTLAIPLTSVENFTAIVPRNPSAGGVQHKRGSQVYRFRTYRRLYLGNGAR